LSEHQKTAMSTKIQIQHFHFQDIDNYGEAINNGRAYEKVKNVENFIIENLDTVNTVQSLCSSLSMNERTLRHNFRKVLGISPKQYIKSHMLNRVRADIKSASSNALISEIANKWGFWHMGQFAADYRKMFGELPSQTAVKG